MEKEEEELHPNNWKGVKKPPDTVSFTHGLCVWDYHHSFYIPGINIICRIIPLEITEPLLCMRNK
jgi:hypothetical protein